MGKLGLGCAAIVLLLIVIVGLGFAGTYNTLNRKNQAVNAQWAQVQNVYQRRSDLIPNLVATVAGAANFEKASLMVRRPPRSTPFPYTALFRPLPDSHARITVEWLTQRLGQ